MGLFSSHPNEITFKQLVLFTAVLIGISNLDGAFSGIRYIKYAIAPLLLFLWIATSRKINNGVTLYGYLLILIYGCISLLWGDLSFGIKDIVFIAAYVMPILFFYTYKVSVEDLFKIYSLFFFLGIPFKEVGSFSIADSSAMFEGAESFVFGAFVISFMLEKNTKYLFVAIILMFLTLKRIALLGVIACFIIWLMPVYIRRVVLSIQAVVIFNALALMFLFLLSMGYLNDAIELLTGKSATVLTLGRMSHYQGVIEAIMQNPSVLFYGAGAGASYEMAAVYYTGDHLYANLHSDTLKILFEYGIIITLLFLSAISKLKTDESRLFFVYVIILFISDNVLIYTSVMFFILYMMLTHNFNFKSVNNVKVKG